MASFGDPAGFELAAGGATDPTTLAVGEYSVWEVLAELPDDWSLDSITCSDDGDAVVDLTTAKVTVTVDDGDAIVCTFANSLESGGTGPDNTPPGEGTLGGNPPLPNTAMAELSGSPSAALLALLMLLGLGTGALVTTAEVRRRQ
jgi:hypothetical protein